MRGSDGRVLAPGAATGVALRLDEPLSLWGGLDPATGEVIDRRHPQSGVVVTGRVLLLPGGRGSSSSSSVLAEAIRARTAPTAIVMREPDSIVALGAIVAAELYELVMPVIVVDPDVFDSIDDGTTVSIEGGRISMDQP